MIFRILISVFWIGCTLNFVAAQDNYILRAFTTRDGLPHNHILSIAQDSTGFLWIATWDGLSRYDGYEFKNYYHNPLDTNTFPYFTVNNLAVSKENQLFVSCTNFPPALYLSQKDCFQKIIPLKMFKDNSLSVTSKGKVYFYYPGEGLMKWNQVRFHPIPVPIYHKTEEKAFFSDEYGLNITFDNLDNLWLFQYNPNNIKAFVIKMEAGVGQVMQVFTIPIPMHPYLRKGLNPPLFLFPYMQQPNDTFLITLTGLNRLSAAMPGRLIPVTESPNIEKNTDSDFLIWPDGHHHIVYQKPGKAKPDSIHFPENPFLSTIFRDRQGSIWASALSENFQGKGLVQAVQVKPFFRHYLGNEDPTGNTNAFFAVHKDRFGTIWAAARNLHFIYMITPGGKISRVNHLKDPIPDLASHPRSFLEDSAGIWIGYYFNLLMRYDFDSGKFSQVYYQKSALNDNGLTEGFRDLSRLGNGVITALDNSLYMYDPVNSRLSQKIEFRFKGPEKYALNKLIRTSTGEFFTGFNFGTIRRYNASFQQTAEWRISKVSYNVEDLCPGDNNDLWAALLGGGLAHIDMESSEIKLYTTADGLSNNTCYSILKDKKGNLWISTNQGISRFNPETRRFRNFGESDGLKITEFNSDAGYLAPDGEMFFGGMGDIVSFYPDSLKEDDVYRKPAPLVITEFKVSGQTRYFEKAIYDMDTVRLSKGDNNFQLTFACLDFQHAEKIRYRYRMAGGEQNWTETGFRERFVNYSEMKPGTYPLEIEAADINGHWVSKTSLTVVIPPQYYQTLWFRLLVLTVLTTLLASLVINYNKRIRMKARQEQDQLKLESLRGQMNPHFIFNSLNSINYFIAQNDRLSANRYIADFSRLIRNILGNLSREYIPFEKELESLEDYLKLEHLRFGDKFDYKLNLPDPVLVTDLMVFPGMVQPFVENAIWHGVRGLEGRKGLIKIDFSWNGSSLICTVEDDGIGRKLSEGRKSDLPGKTSRGIGIVLERLRIVNSLKKTNHLIVIDDLYPGKEETGTRVIIDIPVKEN